ncbi:hypothetical protein [Herminiimonas sp. CN]|uniref:hypothetical protein n=1 Tax=Herminiimonas sp. CN TaxID=1349818 RepID=UPI0004733942|nr:hypothetical protein [Herminiimonas sp. CN]
MTQPDFTYYQKETLFDISFNLGHAWGRFASEAQDRIMDSIGGSRSLAELAMLWAEEFDKAFAVRIAADPDCDTYMEDVDSFFHEKWELFIAGHVAERMAEGVNA